MLFRQLIPLIPLLLLLLLLLLPTFLLSSSAFAAFNDTYTSTIIADRDVDIDVPQTPHYQILHREDFINTSQTLGDLLQKVNGIQIRQVSGLGSQASVSIRGSTTKQVHLYIDGQLINDSLFGGFDLNQLPTEQIDSIEISKSQAQGTGSTPIGGVIRINTYNPQVDSARLSIAGGSFGFREVNAMANRTFSNSNLAVGFSHVQSANDYDYLVPQNFIDPAITEEDKLRNSAYKKNTLHINSEVYLGQHLLRFNMQYSEQRKELANYQNNSPENSSEISGDSWRFGYLHSWQSAYAWLEQLEFEAYTQLTEERYLKQPAGTIDKRATYRTVKNFAGFKSILNVADMTITPFIHFNDQTFESSTIFTDQPASCNKSSCDITATQQQLNYGSRFELPIVEFALTPYVLVSHSREKNSNTALAKHQAAYSAVLEYGTQELGAVYHPTQFDSFDVNAIDFSLFANWSKGTRTPTLFEMFGDRGSFKGNPSLQPEEAQTWSLGSTLSYAGLSLTAAVYQQQLENSIVAIFSSSSVGSYSNVSSAELVGLELQANYSINNALSLMLQTNLIDSHTKSEYRGFKNKRLPGIYHQQYSAAVRYDITEQWQINLRSNIDNELYFNRANSFDGSNNAANRFTTNLQLGWQQGAFTTSLAINNLFDSDYQDLANRPAQGQNIQLKIAIKEI